MSSAEAIKCAEGQESLADRLASSEERNSELARERDGAIRESDKTVHVLVAVFGTVIVCGILAKFVVSQKSIRVFSLFS